ncbi:MAG TPA: glutamyl-tRNA reductase [Chloroflexota bacterium]|nr:glutamyl-tRNA reductase [Chloroflexota bacterium]
MELTVVGMHQRTAEIAVRERLAFTENDLPSAIQALRTYVDEGLIISTCNRVEVYGIVGDARSGDDALRRFLANSHQISHDELAPHLYCFRGKEAVRHLFRLAAGLDSMVLGEDQILNQVKVSFDGAREAGGTGRNINRLLHGALAAGKRVRTHTDIARYHLSVVSVALDIARQELGGIDNRQVAVIGAGRMAELALKHLRRVRHPVAIVNRTVSRAQSLASQYGGTAWPLDQVESVLAEADVVVSCTGAPTSVLSAATVARAATSRQRPLMIFDLAVPRDVEPEVASIPGVRVVDVDSLRPVCEANRAARHAEVSKADALIDVEVAKFVQWLAAQRSVPTIRALRERAESIRIAELERTLARLPSLSPREQDAIRAMSASIVNKLLHQPTVTLKDPAYNGELSRAADLLFQLTDKSRESHATKL